MLSAIGESLPLATGLALSPFAIVTGIVLLLGDRGKSKAALFGLGWFVAILVLATIAMVIVEVADETHHEATETGTDIMQLIFAVIFLGLAAVKLRKHLNSEDAGGKNKLLAKLDKVSVLGALGMGLLQGFVVIKNIPLALGAGAGFGEAGLEGAAAITALLIFAFVSSAGVFVPLAISVVGGQRIGPQLSAARDWLETNMSPITMTVLAILGMFFLGKGLGVFS